MESKEKLFFNRDLSWLSFNDRVLNEAADKNVPILERLRFISIVSSNLREFFMVRVAELKRISIKDPHYKFPDGLNALQVLLLIREEVLRQKTKQSLLLNEIIEELKKCSINIITDFNSIDVELEKELFERFKSLKIIEKEKSDIFDEIEPDLIYIFVRFDDSYVIIRMDKTERLIEFHDEKTSSMNYLFFDRWICKNVKKLFPDRNVVDAFPFKIVKEHILSYNLREDESVEDFLEYRYRIKSSKIIMMEVDAQGYSETVMFLASLLRLDSVSIYRFDMPLDMASLMKVYTNGDEKLKYPKVTGFFPEIFNSKGILQILNSRDIIIHHPYDSFDIVVNFIKEGVNDNSIVDIYHVVYRTDTESEILKLLIEAASKGKNVYVYVEVKARFDELNNLRWIKELKTAGVKIIPPLKSYKVHSKVTQLVKSHNGKEYYYTHLGTGNYNSVTAKQYTDMALLTSNYHIGKEVNFYFKALAKKERIPHLHHLMVAPINLRNNIIKMIKEEINYHKEYGNGHIIAKMNSLVDVDIIKALYEASKSGVKIELIVRGICCLKPQVKGISENITVISIIDRFLEHSRVYYFKAGGRDKLYLSSADWMPRNFYSRFEIAFPIYDPVIKDYVINTVLKSAINDNTKAWLLMPDGIYIKKTPRENEEPLRSQFLFLSLAEKYYKDTPLEKL